MDIKASRRVSERTQRSGYDRVRGGTVNNICAYWLAGRCNRNPCRFMHGDSLPSQPPKQSTYRQSKTWRRSPEDGVNKSFTLPSGVAAEKISSIKLSEYEHNNTPQAPEKVCNYWLSGNCVHGEKCKNLHSWFSGKGFSMLAKLEGHNKAVTGIALPCDSDKLYSCGKDKTLRVWDCNTGQCVNVVNHLGEVGCLISEGPWLLVGLQNSVKAWNTQTQAEMTLNGPVGQVSALAVDNDDVVFAGTEDGSIFAWKPSSETNGLELAASLKGHSSAVISLRVGANRLYSGSMDNTIRVWDLKTFECVQTLSGHTGAVMSVLCWDSFLLSCSLDGTLKAWAATEVGNIEEIYTYKEEHGFLDLCGFHDPEGKPVLLCSCNDNTVHVYDLLPSFKERGRLFTNQEVQPIQFGPGGLVFTGDATGQLTVWKLSGEPSAVAS